MAMRSARVSRAYTSSSRSWSRGERLVTVTARRGGMREI